MYTTYGTSRLVVDALPRTASGKADLAAVRELVAASIGARS